MIELKEMKLPCLVSCYREQYAEVFDIYITAEAVRFLIKDEIKDNSILDGLELYKCDLQEYIEESALSNIDDDGEYEYECESKLAYVYIQDIVKLINNILDGLITEETIDKWLTYFDVDEMDLYEDIDEWWESIGKDD